MVWRSWPSHGRKLIATPLLPSISCSASALAKAATGPLGAATAAAASALPAIQAVQS